MLVRSKCNWKPHQGILEALRQHSYLSSFLFSLASTSLVLLFKRVGFPTLLQIYFPHSVVGLAIFNSLLSVVILGLFLLIGLTHQARQKIMQSGALVLSLKAKTVHCIESALWSKYCFFLNSLGLCGVDLLDKIKAFLDHLWKMAIFSDAIVDINHHLLQIWTSHFAENSEHRKTAHHL